MRNKNVAEELPAWRLFGPQGREVAALIEQTAHLTKHQIEDLIDAQVDAWGIDWDDARDTARRAAVGVGRGAAWTAVQDAAWDAVRSSTLCFDWHAVRGAVRGAVLGWLVRDSISDEDFRTLTGPWVSVMGRSLEVTA